LKFSGPWFYQVKENSKGELIFLEIASRIAASTSFHWLNGVNIPLLAIEDALGEEITIFENNINLQLDRTLWSWRYRIHFPFKHVYLKFKGSNSEELFKLQTIAFIDKDSIKLSIKFTDKLKYLLYYNAI